MALNADIHWGCILRVDVQQPIKQEGWKCLLSDARFGFNFDGEIFAFGFGMVEHLRDFGFHGVEAGDEADFVDVDRSFRKAVEDVNWLERLEVKPLIEGIRPFHAWKLKKSNVFTVQTLDDRLVSKGTHVDWEPFIGKIY